MPIKGLIGIAVTSLLCVSPTLHKDDVCCFNVLMCFSVSWRFNVHCVKYKLTILLIMLLQ